jgi:serine/threonine protein kinase
MATDPRLVKHVFLDAVEQRDRAGYLDRACADDPDLRSRVEKLLAAHDAAARDPILDAPAVAPRPEETFAGTDALVPWASVDATVDVSLHGVRPITEGPGTLIGPYKLLQKIGEGGMGVVYMAEQERPVRRRVALKIIKPGMDSVQVIARFEAERQALALMDHPNIARVLDAGTTDSGRPYFAMELVKGVPITQYCDECRFGPRERLALFARVCAAVQHAHQKGIIHRDIKPSNVLVTLVDGRPMPKVIDFGVAKAIEQRLTERSMFTQYGAVVGTLEYMSPEQASLSAVDVDTRSDIYSLGVLAYELLTGATPLDRERVRDAAYDEVLRRIKDEEPPRPSTRLSGSGDRLVSIAATRGVEPARLTRLVRGELDWIVMKALEKDRGRRYETADGLARDIERYLDGDPVEACPPGAWYRLKTFGRRHRGPLLTAVGFTFALFLAAVLFAGLAVAATRAQRLALIEAHRAHAAEAEARAQRDAAELDRIRAEQAEAAARTEAEKARAINEFLNKDLLGQAEPARNAVEDKVTLLELLDRAAADVGRRFEGQPEVEKGLRETIARTYSSLASYDRAASQWRAVLASVRVRSGPDSAETYRAEDELAYCLLLGGHVDEASSAMARSAAEGLARTLGPDHPDTLRARGHLARFLLAARRYDEGVALILATLREREARLGPDHPDSLKDRAALAEAYRATGRWQEGIALVQGALRTLIAKLGADHPETLALRVDLANLDRAVGRDAEAIALYEATLQAAQSRLGPDHPVTLQSMHGLAQALGPKRPAEAEELFRRVLDAAQRTQGPIGPLTVESSRDLALVFDRTGRPQEAEAILRDLIQRQSAQTPAQPLSLADSLLALGRVLQGQKRWLESEAVIRACLDVRLKQAPDDWRTFVALSHLGGSLMGLGRNDEAAPVLLRTYEGLKAREGLVPAPERRAIREAADRLVQVFQALGKTEQADEFRRRIEREDPGR